MGSILGTVINGLPVKDQLELLERFLTYFVNQGILDPSVMEKCGAGALTEAAKAVFEQ